MLAARKKQRHTDLLQLRTLGVKDSALAKIIDVIRNGRPGLVADMAQSVRHDMQRALADTFDDIGDPLQLQLNAGRLFQWKVMAPDKQLQQFVERSPAFEQLVREAVHRHGNTLSLILYHDEITAGNALRADNRRKIVAVYWSFREFGLALRSELAWMPVACIRHTKVQEVTGGLSAVVAALMRRFFLGPAALSVGVVVALRTGPTLVIARMGFMILDEAALKATFDFKGASGTKPCACCKNVISKSSDLVINDPTNYLVDISESNHSNFDLLSDEDIWRLYDVLEAQKPILGAGAFDQLERACGITWNQHGLLADRALRAQVKPSSSILYETMHSYFAHGAAAVEMHLFIGACSAELGLKFEHFEVFCSADWKMAKTAHKLNPAVLWSANREKASSDSYKGMATELLQIFPLVRHFADTIVENTGRIRNQLQSFRAMSDIVVCLQTLKRRSAIPEAGCQELELLQRAHMRAFMAAYGQDEFKPKHHFCMHVPSQLRRHGMLFDAFTLERKHRTIKRHACNIVNTSGDYEWSVLMKSVAEQFTAMPGSFADSLIGPRTQSDDVATLLSVPHAIVAESVQINGYTISADDIVTVQGHALQVALCAQIGHSFHLVGKLFSHSCQRGNAHVWQRVPHNELVIVSPVDVLCEQPSFWTFMENGNLMTLP